MAAAAGFLPREALRCPWGALAPSFRFPGRTGGAAGIPAGRRWRGGEGGGVGRLKAAVEGQTEGPLWGPGLLPRQPQRALAPPLLLRGPSATGGGWEGAAAPLRRLPSGCGRRAPATPKEN
jgi:hypothetical protein